MRQDKVVNIILAVVNAILVIVCAVLYFRTDRTEPRFVIQPAEVVYTPGMEETDLYEGISAHDDRDGDLTDKIVVEKVVENQEEGTAIIYYAVSDAAGNTAKFSKLFQAEYPVEVSAAVSESGREGQMVMELQKDQPSQAGVGEAVQPEGETGSADHVTDVAGSPVESDDGTNNETGDNAVKDNGQDTAAADADGVGVDEAADENGRTEGRDNEPPAIPAPEAGNSSAPELVFRTTEVKVDSGANVPWTEIISTLRDDKDDYATLYYNLQVGQYNRNKPGTYQVDVYTEDSDGNRSQTVPVTVIVR